MAAAYRENACVICQVAVDIKRTEWLELLKGSKVLETEGVISMVRAS